MPDWLPEMVTSLGFSALGGRGRFRRYNRFREEWLGTDPMPSVIFIEPEYTDGPHAAPNDDHPPSGIAKGQALIADVYATLTANAARWQTTLLVITYDEHGGFYDHVPPLPIASSPGGVAVGTTGLRVPAFLVSPHVAPGVPFSVNLDHTSFLQLLAERFTPAKDYSADVAARQSALGRISGALNQVAAETPSLPAAMTAQLAARVAAAPASNGTAQAEGPAKTASAFDTVAQSLADNHPDVLAGPGWEKLAQQRKAQGLLF
jgi:phospholipase C